MAVVVRYEVPESLNVRVRRMKFVAIPLNVLISLVGIAIAVLATYLRLSSYAALYIRDILEYYRTDIKVETVYLILYGFLAAGVLTTMIGTLGVIGSYRQNFRALIVFAIFLAVVILGKGACAMTIYFYKDQIKCALQHKLVDEVGLLFRSTGSDYGEKKRALEIMQTELGCCGCYNVSDYDRSKTDWTHVGAIDLPAGCYVGEYHETGCCDVIWGRIVCMTITIGCISLGYIVLELAAFVLALLMASTIFRVRTSGKNTLTIEWKEDEDRMQATDSDESVSFGDSARTSVTRVPGPDPKTHSLFSKSGGPILAYVPEESTHL